MVLTVLPAAPSPVDPAARRIAIGRLSGLIGWCAGFGGVSTVAMALPAIWRLSPLYGGALSVLVLAELASFVGVLVRPDRGAGLFAAGAAASVALSWLLKGALPAPDPWAPLNGAIGFVAPLTAGLHVVVAVVLGVGIGRAGRCRLRGWRRVGTSVCLVPVLIATVGAAALGLAAGGDTLTATTEAPSTVEYCRPAGLPLLMDVYPPSAERPGGAPVVMYVHGGGFVLGDRRTTGLGARVAGHDGALFTPVQRRLNALGVAVVSIDYRLTPGAYWRAPLEDAKCAVRFLRANAGGLGIDPARIGVWGSSAGGQLASLLGLAGPSAGFDTGQYAGQSSAVQAVVDMFGPTDMADLADAGGFMRTMVAIGVGDSDQARAALSPIDYVTAGRTLPPFLILHGDADHGVPIRHSERLADRLTAAGVPTTFVPVAGAAHTLATPGERPSAPELTDLIVGFLDETLKPASGF